MIKSGSITLNLLKECNNDWSLVITMNNSATHTCFNSMNLEDAQTIALSKLQEMVDKINQDMAPLS